MKKQLEPNAGGEDTPENILRVSRGTSFEGLKTARRVALEAADAPDGGGEERKARVEWAFDALIAQSRDFFLKATEANPEDADAHFRLGNFYQTLEKFEDAEACYRKSANLDNTHVDSMNNLAMILQETGRIDEAEAFYLRCVEVDSEKSHVHVQLGHPEASSQAGSRRVSRPHQPDRRREPRTEGSQAGEGAARRRRVSAREASTSRGEVGDPRGEACA